MHTLITFIAQYLIVVPVLAWLYVLLRLPKTLRLRFVLFSAAGLVLTFLLAKLASTIHHDPRPFVRDHVTPYFTSSTDDGFPSDHTTYSALIAFVIWRFNRKLGLVLALIAVAIGAARVIAGVHHGQDVIAGLIIAAIAVGLVWAGERLLAKPKTAVQPK